MVNPTINHGAMGLIKEVISKPKVFTSEETKDAAICGCKQTKNPPYCDGSHASL